MLSYCGSRQAAGGGNTLFTRVMNGCISAVPCLSAALLSIDYWWKRSDSDGAGSSDEVGVIQKRIYGNAATEDTVMCRNSVSMNEVI